MSRFTSSRFASGYLLLVLILIASLLTSSSLKAQEGDANSSDTSVTTAAPTDEPTTEVPTEAPTTEVPPTEAPTTEAPPTDVPTTDVPTTEAPTEIVTTEAPPVDMTDIASPTGEATLPAVVTEQATDTTATDVATVTTTATATEALPDEPAMDIAATQDFNRADLSDWRLGLGWAPVSHDAGLALQLSQPIGAFQFIPAPLDDVAIEAQFKLDDAAGQLIAHQTADGSYSATLDADGKVELDRSGDKIGSAKLDDFDRDDWHSLRLSVVDGIVRVAVDGQEVIATLDADLLPAGAVTVGGTIDTDNGNLSGSLMVDDVVISLTRGTSLPEVQVVLTPTTEVPTELPTDAPTEVATEVTTDIATEEVVATVTAETPDATPEATVATFAPNGLVGALSVGFTVNSTGDESDADTSDGMCLTSGSVCTLRAAIEQANATSGADTISFAISTGEQTIAPDSPLPAIEDPVTIDGYTQPGAIAATGSSAATLKIRIDGSSISEETSGLSLQASNSTIRGLNIVNFTAEDYSDAISVGGSNNHIEGNYLGTNFAGTSALPNKNGLTVYLGTNNIIGGTTPAARNVISGNLDNGIKVVGDDSSSSATARAVDTIIQGNYIGTNASGTNAIGNGNNGLWLYYARNTTVGGTTAAARNIISGNGQNAVWVGGTYTPSATIQGNYLGTDVSGSISLLNRYGGVSIDGASNVLVGGMATGAGNLISGNSDGIDNEYYASGVGAYNGANHIIVQGNIIGLNAAGTAAIPNDSGIDFTGVSNNTIGGTSAAARNIISGNGIGIYIGGYDGATGTGNLIQGNYIGTNPAGTGALPNLTGIMLDPFTNTTTIGGMTAGVGNVISGNINNGIVVNTGADHNTVQGNFIGLNAAGTAGLGNHENGIVVNSASNTIGGTTAAARNIISGNGTVSGYEDEWGTGVNVSGGASQNLIQGNYLGLNVAGTASIPNDSGVIIYASSQNTVGGTAAGARNIISGNAEGGVIINGSDEDGTSSLNLIQGNYVGTNPAGNAAIPNGGGGIVLSDHATQTTIGGTASGARNVISGNQYDGIYMGGGTSSNQVIGNYIGVNAAGTGALANNGGYGVNLDASNSNMIGGTLTAARNIIASNGNGGVDISAGSAFNTVLGNYIGLNASGAAMGNAGIGVGMSEGAHDNTIGGTASGARNIISGNNGQGIDISGNDTANNVVLGNTIGLNAAGSAAIANANNGILIEDGAHNNTIGGTASGAGNILSGNTESGISIGNNADPDNPAHDNIIVGNLIGSDITGKKIIGNGRDGVSIDDGAFNNTIGGTVAVARNIIVGAYYSGIALFGPSNIVQGNYIGVDITGAKALANGSTNDGGDGIFINADNNTIGGTLAGTRNIISGNKANGVHVSESNGTLIQGNYIGTDLTGTKVLPNGAEGVAVGEGSASTTIGGTIANARNIISGNLDSGIAIYDADTASNTVQGNFIGTDVTGTKDLGNSGDGVAITDGAHGNTVGGSTAGARNLISGNGQSGVGTGVGLYGGDDNTVQGNYIGTDVTGTKSLANGDFGIALGDDADGNLIGGTNTGEGNKIAYNTTWGIRVFTDDSSGNTFEGNNITANGQLGIDLDPTGVTPNDPLDTDSGPNDLQNYPLLTAITPTQISGTLSSLPTDSFRIELFTSSVCDSTGFGEGQNFLGAVDSVMTNGSGDATFNFALGTSLAANTVVTATATDLNTGNTSEFSPCFIYTSGPVSKAPTLSAPASGSATNDTTPRLTFSTAANASTYQVQVSTNSTFTNIVFDQTGSQRTIDLPTPLSDGTYYWRVRGISGSGGIGPFSKVFTFIIDTTPPSTAPSVVSPADNTQVTTAVPTFKWNALAGAASYYIEVSNTSDFDVIYGYPVKATSFTLPATDTQTQGLHYWHVAAVDAAGNQGPYGDPVPFTIFIGTAPADGAFLKSGKVSFKWTAISSATGYLLQVDDSADFDSPILSLALGKVTSYTLSTAQQLATGGTYYWRVLERTPVAEPTNTNLHHTFFITATTPVAPLQTAPADKATVSSMPTFDWNAVAPPSGVTLAGYEIWVASDKNFTQNVQKFNSATDTYTPTIPLTAGTKYWRVRAIYDVSTPGAWSKVLMFKVS